jgi:hypothetical protein
VVVIQADTNNSGESDNPTLLFIQDGTYRTSEIGNDTNNGMVYRSYGDQIWYSSSVHSNTSNTALKDSQTERMRIKNNGNVGIGTDSPAQKLDVAGRIRADTMELDSYIYHVGDTNSYLGFSSADHFKINVNNLTRFKVDSNGKAGFGLELDITPPLYTLHVSGDCFGRHLLYGGDADSGSTGAIARSCMKTRDSGGHPYCEFEVYAPTFMGWIPFTFTLQGSSVNTNGSSHFERQEANGHGRYYNGSQSTNGVSGVTFTATQSGNNATLRWTMDDYGRDQTILSVQLNFEGGIFG